MLTVIIRKSMLLIFIMGCVVSPALILTTNVWWKEVIALTSLFINLSLVSSILTTVIFYNDIRES